MFRVPSPGGFVYDAVMPSLIPPEVPPVIAGFRPDGPGPVLPVERIETLDVLRGFALFGILLVNMALFGWPVYQLVLGNPMGTASRADAVAGWTIRILAEGKFYSLFSFLFGVGVAIQMERADAHGVPFAGRYARRLTALFGIGLAHTLLLWEGDILVLYAILGFLLLAFLRCQSRTLLIWAAVFLALPVLLYAAFWVLFAVASMLPNVAGMIEKELAAANESYARQSEENLRVFAQGGMGEIFVQRGRNVAFLYQFVWVVASMVFPMFLLGFCAGRRGILRHVGANLPWVRRVGVWGLLIGLPASGVYALGHAASDASNVNFASVVALGALAISGPALGLCYASGLVLLLQREGWRRALQPVAAAGRMALSNYLFQSLVCTTLFYSYGLGWYGSVGMAAGAGLAVVIYAVQLPLSVWWLKRFRFGPAEWLWRRLTYGREAMRR
ncbi:MAG: DUF418 domain-containing protein [Verrucomicrobiae bacterium]|nr:DUF418 domain-containing protein [Verrucomicrobiae bacterium]